MEKKTYIEPKVKVKGIQNTEMIAASTPVVNEPGGGALSKEIYFEEESAYQITNKSVWED